MESSLAFLTERFCTAEVRAPPLRGLVDQRAAYLSLLERSLEREESLDDISREADVLRFRVRYWGIRRDRIFSGWRRGTIVVEPQGDSVRVRVRLYVSWVAWALAVGWLPLGSWLLGGWTVIGMASLGILGLVVCLISVATAPMSEWLLAATGSTAEAQDPAA
jgi:hypothetical protein